MTAAQALFKTEERKQDEKKKILINRGMALWDTSAEAYRDLPKRYTELLAEKRSKKITPIEPLKPEVLEEYPKIEFFEIKDRDEAKAWLARKCLSSLENEISFIDFIFEGDYSYRTVRNWVRDATYKLERARAKKERGYKYRYMF